MSASPTFDRGGKYLYFTESTNYGTSTSGLDMSSDAFNVTRSIYGLTLAADAFSPVAPQSEDEKLPDAKDKDKDKDKKDSSDEHADKDKSDDAKKDDTRKSDDADKPEKAEKAEKAEKPKPVKIDLEHLQDRAVALPLPASGYTALTAGKDGTLYVLENGSRFQADRGETLTRFVLKTKKSEKLADHVAGFDLSSDGNKMLLEMAHGESDGAAGSGWSGARHSS